MSGILTEDVGALLGDARTVRILATTGPGGAPHAAVKQSLHLGGDGNIHYLERLESSITNRNLVNAIWFDRGVSLLLLGADGRSVQIEGRPVKLHVTGPLFLEHYARLADSDPDSDLAGVWVIRPESVRDQTPDVRRVAEDAAHPHFIHLDRLARR